MLVVFDYLTYTLFYIQNGDASTQDLVIVMSVIVHQT